MHSIRKLVGSFNAPEIGCTLEFVDIFLNDLHQPDCSFVMAGNGNRDEAVVHAGAGPAQVRQRRSLLDRDAPCAQGKGIDRALMRYLEKRVHDELGRMLSLETSWKESHDTSVGFHRRLGYKEASRIRNFCDVGDDKLIDVKRLSR